MTCCSKRIKVSTILYYNIVDKPNLIRRRMGISTIREIETNGSNRKC